MRANLRAAIEHKFGTQLSFARAVGLHPVRINRICQAWVEPTRVERERISQFLAADPDWLFAAFRIPAKKAAATEEIAAAEI